MSDDCACDYTPGIPGEDLQNVPKIINNIVSPASLHSAQGDKVQCVEHG